MPQLSTIKKRADYLAVRGGARSSHAGFLIEGRARAGTPAAGARVGYTVTKKLGNAVVRNRIRRRLKAAIAQVGPQAARDGFDYVLVARPAAALRPFPELLTDLQSAFSRLHRAPSSPSGRAPNEPQPALKKGSP